MEQEYNHPLYMLNKATRGGVSKAGAATSGPAPRVAAARSISLPHPPPYSLVSNDAASAHHA